MPQVKSTKYKRNERRQKEILKAQAKTFLRYSDYSHSKDDNGVSSTKISIEKKMNALNLKVIKSDLLKTSFYVIFVIIMVYVIKTLNLELNLGINK